MLTSIMRLEHPELGPRRWQLNAPEFAAGLTQRGIKFGRSMMLREPGRLLAAPGREFAFTKDDAWSFAGEIGKEIGIDGWLVTWVRRWEAWAL
jgi:hypothetical protein